MARRRRRERGDQTKRGDRPHLETSQEHRLEQMPGYLLRRAENVSASWYYKLVGDTEITPRQFAILLTLFNHGRMTQSKLAELTGTDRSTITEMVTRMEKRKLISRSVPLGNRRALHLTISEAGISTLMDILPKALLSQKLLLEPLPMEYRRIFMHCLEMLAFPKVRDVDIEQDIGESGAAKTR